MAELITPVIATKNDFEPEITAFYCIYCGYMAADTAGAMHVQYPANVKFVRLPCTGKMDIRYVLEAFEQGADGVLLDTSLGELLEQANARLFEIEDRINRQTH